MTMPAIARWTLFAAMALGAANPAAAADEEGRSQRQVYGDELEFA